MTLLTEEVHLIQQATFNWIDNGFQKSLKPYIHDDPDGYHISDIIFWTHIADYVILFSNHISLCIYKTIYLVQIKLVGPTVNSKGSPVSSGKRIWYDVAWSEGLWVTCGI